MWKLLGFDPVTKAGKQLGGMLKVSTAGKTPVQAERLHRVCGRFWWKCFGFHLRGALSLPCPGWVWSQPGLVGWFRLLRLLSSREQMSELLSKILLYKEI